MPHLILDCSEPVVAKWGAARLMQTVYDVARDSGLFAIEDIKVRIHSYSQYITAGGDDDFVHVFAYIMEGRTIEQRHALSKAVVAALTKLAPDVPIISMNVIEFEKATYNNRKSVSL